MRITNKIMQNNSLSNINMTKVNEDRLSSQMTTGKKNVRPSDDPVTAIRALRLRSNVTQITQYYKNNSKDAEAWLDTTADALEQEVTVLDSIITQYTNGVNQYLTSSDRQVILTELEALRDEVYATGDVDYAGRYVFTGYRTDTSLMFREDTEKTYTITEQLTADDILTGYHVDTIFTATGTDDDGNATTTDTDLLAMTEGTYTAYTDVTEQEITNSTYHRIRTSYKDLDNAGVVISYSTDASTATTASFDVESLSSTVIPSPYDRITTDAYADKAIFLADTGEILLGSNVYSTLSTATNIDITYQKTSWEEGDLRPEHYFFCATNGTNGTNNLTLTVGTTSTSTGLEAFASYVQATKYTTTDTVTLDTGDDILYNETYLSATADKQVIEYDVGFNQRLQVNTTADEAFDPSVVREIDDMISAINNLTEIEELVGTLEDMIDATTDDTVKATLQQQLDAANKAYDYAAENVKTMFESGITTMQNYQEKVTLAATDCGARGERLELIQARLVSQKSTFEELQSENEDVDLAETAVKLASAELSYEASLQATSKIMKTNLMQYI
ncbi:MAG: hypothetical protein K6G23_06960 [Lachnospiraceae bacterium]|nr:hypothetical protein [Lachnospiraceae bacterium]